MSELAGELFGTALSVGAVDAICRRAAGALERPHERLVVSVRESGALNIDETGWCRTGEGRTMWTAATQSAAVFRIAKDRHRDRLEELLGEGYAGSRLFGPLVGVCPPRPRATPGLLGAHHARRPPSRGGTCRAEALWRDRRGAHRASFEVWRAFAEHKDRRRLRREMTPVQNELRTLLGRAERSPSCRRRF